MTDPRAFTGARRLASAGFVAALLALAAFTLPARPAAPARERPIEWSLRPPAGAVTQGKEFAVGLHAMIPMGWHLYSLTQPTPPIAMTITILPGQPVILARSINAPEPDVAPDKNFEIMTETYVDSVTFPLRLLAKEAGATTLRVEIFYQTCNDSYCLPPITDTLALPLQVAAGQQVSAAALAAAPAAVPRDSVVPPAASVANATAPATGNATSGGSGSSTSLLFFLLSAAAWGAVSLLTPCVFPMVPITISYFTQRGAVSRGAAVRQAVIYAGGIMATFTILGLAIALLLGAGGVNRFAANPWINLLVTLIFGAFALNLFGVFQVALPSELLTRLDGAAQGDRGRGTMGALLMGLTFTLTSFTCTAPLVGTLLVTAAQGDRTWPVLGLLTYSAVFAFPFFLLALVPGAVQRLPRSGAWLGVVKPVLGCVELAMAFKFLSNADLVMGWGIFTRNVVLGVWLALAVVVVVLLLDLIPRLRGGSFARLSWMRLGLAAAAIAVAVLLGRGLAGARIGELESFLPPREGRVVTGSTAVAGELPWIVNDYAAALVQAKAEGKAVLIDFTGYTCTNCRWMEANMFPREDVIAELNQFVRVRLYTDGRGEPYLAQQALEQQIFGTVALPLYAVMDNSGGAHGNFKGMTRSPAEFIAFLAQSRGAALDRGTAP